MSDAQQLEIRVAVVCPTWVSGTKIGSFTEAASSALNHWANCPSFPLRHLSSPFLCFSVKVRLAHLQVSRDSPACYRGTGITDNAVTSSFTWMLWNQTRILVVIQQVIHLLSYLLSPSLPGWSRTFSCFSLPSTGCYYSPGGY